MDKYIQLTRITRPSVVKVSCQKSGETINGFSARLCAVMTYNMLRYKK